MASRNVEIVERLYEAWNSGDPEPAPELAPDVEWVNPPEAVESGTRHGRDEFREAMARVREGFGEMRIEIEELVESGDHVAVSIVAHTRGRGSGLEAPNRMSHLWTFRDGWAVRFEWFRDPHGARAALDG